MKITVFTPTYNRAYIIENLYRSLQRQTCMDFEWLVVDDGSVDNTEELFAKWIQEDNPFPIRYYTQPNGGKHRAINRALELAQGEWFFTVDSDDYLTDDAIEKITVWIHQLPQQGKWCGVSGNLGLSPAETPNKLFENGFAEATLLDRYSYINGERALIFSTEIHRQYPYPEFDGEKFMTEAVSWNRMAADGYSMGFYNDIICIYKYLPDGLTQSGSKLFRNNPRGHGLWLREKSRFLNESRFNRLKMIYSFYCDHTHHLSKEEIRECIGSGRTTIEIISLLRKIRGIT